MWEIQPERLRDAMARAAVNQSQLADAVGLKQPSIGRLLSGETKTSRALNEIAAYLETTPQYLVGASDDPTSSSAIGSQLSPLILEESQGDETVYIQELDLAFGMGNSFLGLPVKETKRSFSRGWLSMFTRAHPSKIYLARGIGDSMAPTIHNDDIILIDASVDTIRMSDQIWAFAYGDYGMIKRLRPMPDGGVKILSDNPSVSDETAYDGELHVIGKVVAIIRRMAA